MSRWLHRRRRVSCQVSLVEGDSTADPSVYRDGTYLISEWSEARTWAVHHAGRWGVVYEWAGEQPVAGWVSAEQIPLEVRAQALHRTMDEAR